MDLLARVASDPPPEMRLLLTARSGDIRITDRFEATPLDIGPGFEAPADSDLLRYVVQRLEAIPEPQRQVLAERVAAAAAGNFLYAYHVLNDITAQPAPVAVADWPLPEGLPGVYRRYLARELALDRTGSEWRRLFRPVLGVVAVSRGHGLSPESIARAAGLRLSEAEDVLHLCGQFLTRVEGGHGAVLLYHRSFQEFLQTDSTYHVYPGEAHEAVARLHLSEGEVSWGQQSSTYALAHLAYHLHGAGLWDDLVALARDENYLAEQRHRMAHDAEAPLITARLGLDAALTTNDLPAVAELLLRTASRHGGLQAGSPLDRLQRSGAAAAVRLAADLSSDERTLYELLIALQLLAHGDTRQAGQVLREVSSREPDRLTRDDDVGALLLTGLSEADPRTCVLLADQLLSTWGRQYAVRLLLRSGRHEAAISFAETIADANHRHRTFLAIAEETLSTGRPDLAEPWLRSIAHTPLPPGADDEVAWVTACAQALVGELSEAQETLRHKLRAGPSATKASVEPAASHRAHLLACAASAAADPSGRAALLDQAASLAHTLEAGVDRSAVWVQLAKVHLWHGSSGPVRDALRSAAEGAPGMQGTPVSYGEEMYDSEPVHDDAFHGPCVQGLHLELARIAAGAGLFDDALAFAEPLLSAGAAWDGIEVMAHIARSARRTGDQAVARDAFAQASALLERMGQPMRRLVVAAELAFGVAETGWPAQAFPTSTGDLVSSVDAVLRRRAEQRTELAGALAESALLVHHALRGIDQRASTAATALAAEIQGQFVTESPGHRAGALAVLSAQLGDGATALQLLKRVEQADVRRQLTSSVVYDLAERGLMDEARRVQSGLGPELDQALVSWLSVRAQLTHAAETNAPAQAVESLCRQQDTAAMLAVAAAEYRERGRSATADALSTRAAELTKQGLEHTISRRQTWGLVPQVFVTEADELQRHARTLARLGDVDTALKALELAADSDDSAILTVSMGNMWGPDETADTRAERDDWQAGRQVQRLCELAMIARRSGFASTALRYLIAAERWIDRFGTPQVRNDAAVHIARTAAAGGHLDRVPFALDAVTIHRQESLAEAFLAYCTSSPDRLSGSLSKHHAKLVASTDTDLAAAVRVCGGLAFLFPHHARAIWGHLRSTVTRGESAQRLSW
ncbi:hypothetical protein U9R90_21700 [Streptomyces sp. E11-3]|uniref:hypothetical protein n=1 Tax=Streptomyces sp. E11-3 TaxID=3110112 RepID=UPI0039803428